MQIILKQIVYFNLNKTSFIFSNNGSVVFTTVILQTQIDDTNKLIVSGGDCVLSTNR